ncbi:hypothetical protein F4781DRAFT_423354 [Annulohypoxylon bovei var. microspora]|nr:hypothetical protein F4781DRAFT_423354 [Annulohypoxylon bovei var. microspora]
MDFLNVWSGDVPSTGWRQAAKVNSIVLAAMSVTLLGFLIAVTSKVGLYKALFFYDGDCDGGNVSKLNMVLHLLINVVSTLVVTSSNFFMQVLNSPSREEVNAAHFQGSWMGIGVPSVRNAFKVSRFKTWCWICLLLSSIPIHLLFNSAVFQTDRRDSDYHLTIATEEFINGGAYYAPGAGLVQAGFQFWFSTTGLLTESKDFGGMLADARSSFYGAPVNLTDYSNKSSDVMKNISSTALAASNWEKLDIGQCKQEYINCGGLKNHRNVVLIADNPDGWKRNDMWHLMDNQTEMWNRYVPADQPNHLFYDTQCMIDNEWSEQLIYGSTLTSGLQPGTFDLSIKYCLAQPLERVCHIGLSPTLLLAVTICVIFKTCTVAIVTIVLSRRNQPPLVTLGDAIESFLERPDLVTTGMSTIGQNEIRRAMLQKKAFIIPGPRQWQSLRKRRGSVIPISVWATSYLLFAVSISICVYFFNGIMTDGTLFGSFFESEANAFIDIPTTFVGGVLLANSPQLLLSFCYLTYNNLFTRLQMAREWSLYSEGYYPLRVTDPKDEQYSTYRLQLPYKYSIPLIIISISLHWLLSNTIYLFISTGGYFGTNSFIARGLIDPSLPANTAIAVGYSSYSLLGLIVVSCVLVVVPFFLSWKRLPSNMVNIGSNSLALSAACHASILSCAVQGRADSLMLDSPAMSRLDLPETPQPLKQSYTRIPGDTYDESIGGEGFEMRKFRAASVSTIHQSSQLSLASQQLLPDRSSEDGANTGYEKADEQGGPFTKLARSKIRWGVVKMPPEWHAEYDNEAGTVEHLSFGVEKDGVQPPEVGGCYA